LMAAPMIIIELIVMKSMYPAPLLNFLFIALGVLVLVLSFLMIRKQFAVDDRQFLRSMIPHHAGAILMCNESRIESAKIKELCNQIIKGQQEEIDEMKRLLETE
jgi:uncharacterized protein (DUF305 family)